MSLFANKTFFLRKENIFEKGANKVPTKLTYPGISLANSSGLGVVPGERSFLHEKKWFKKHVGAKGAPP